MQLRTQPALSCVIMHLSKHVGRILKLVNGDSPSNSTGKETVVPRDQNLQLQHMMARSGIWADTKPVHGTQPTGSEWTARSELPTDRGPSGGPERDPGSGRQHRTPTSVHLPGPGQRPPGLRTRGGCWGRTRGKRRATSRWHPVAHTGAHGPSSVTPLTPGALVTGLLLDEKAPLWRLMPRFPRVCLPPGSVSGQGLRAQV